MCELFMFPLVSVWLREGKEKGSPLPCLALLCFAAESVPIKKKKNWGVLCCLVFFFLSFFLFVLLSHFCFFKKKSVFYKKPPSSHCYPACHRTSMPGIPATSDQMQLGGELPYMAEEELEEFISLNPELRLSPEEMLYLKAKRKKLSIQRRRDGCPATGAPLVKLVAVGDDSVATKETNLQLFLLQDLTEDAASLAKRTPCAIGNRKVTFSDQHNTTRHHDIEVWAPPCNEGSLTLRKLFYGSASVVLVFFSVSDRTSFHNTRTVWLPELQAHLAQDTPVVIVGNDAEVRHAATPPPHLVSPEEAVALAQEFGAAKYIEVFSNNFYHINEVVQQSLKVLSSMPQWGAVDPAQAEDDEACRAYLTVPDPVGYFDLMNRTFTIKAEPGTKYYVSLSDAEPTMAGMEVTGPIKFSKPYPDVVRVKGFKRCWYPSATLVLPVPEETAPPKGYFDVLRRGFFVHGMQQGSRVHYATDGSKPTTDSPLLHLTQGLLFDSGPPLAATGPTCDGIPDEISLVAVEEGKFRSKVVSLTPPPMLATPKVVYSESDGVMHIPSQQPHVEYRYTLNGAIPACDSMLYTGPVMLPREQSAYRIRVAAFPKLSFPSRVVDVMVNNKGEREHHGGNAPTVAMTKSARARISRNSQRVPLNQGQGHGAMKRSGSGQSRTSSRSNSNRRRRSSGGTAASSETTDSVVTCSTRNNALDFDFEEPIAITHLTVATPGGGRGPTGYSILVKEKARTSYTEVGSGRLSDLNGIQVMHVDNACKSLQAVKVQVNFTKPHGGLFRINNVQIHGKPAVPCP
eukprot:TRINITY_DN1318_c3_g1_i2.p1 TRINITY_DN1318_c3_g1~~TRINITY_DN1318_c3_g1_i2.p1  ORF type:complete len:797 (+),score=185.46 TRINITY_DN1318_c3_g1_i2:88-2478(+)